MILEPELPVEEVRARIVGKLKKYFAACGKTEAVVGLSGGIDSALVFALACEALGSDHVQGILMPSPYSTLHSVADAVDLAENLKARYQIVPIENIFRSYTEELREWYKPGELDISLENLQARIRGALLMTYSNRYGALLLNTSNKSELFMGYGTLYGDLCGALMVIADLYKLQVYELAANINADRTVIPISTMTKAPSAELRPDQKDSDSLPPYEKLDPILHALHEEGLSPETLVSRGVKRELIDRIVRLKNASAFKALQIPAVITVGSHPLVPEWKCI